MLPTAKSFDAYRERPVTLTILGAGAWGSALAQLARHNGHTVR
ncbi:MAG: glycerol-3-phosphate dehydrogenase, partial [Leptolyngbyaceae cyanobacterium SM2_5_2]|nr:glycerol-3-phosphate dehydrogenase [Leptolyngbyaceae cyanobacterium SM2_5_2]